MQPGMRRRRRYVVLPQHSCLPCPALSTAASCLSFFPLRCSACCVLLIVPSQTLTPGKEKAPAQCKADGEKVQGGILDRNQQTVQAAWCGNLHVRHGGHLHWNVCERPEADGQGRSKQVCKVHVQERGILQGGVPQGSNEWDRSDEISRWNGEEFGVQG